MAFGSPRVLIADDGPQLLRVLVQALEKNGYPVVTASNGVEAIRVFRDAPDEITVVVLDAAMGPHGAGDVLTTVAKERPRLGVVITSAGQLPDSLRSLRLAHGGILLRKPFARSALLCVVEDSLTREDA